MPKEQRKNFTPAVRCRTSTKWTNAPGVDALITNLCWKALGLDPSTTLHDVRWGEHYKGDGANGSGKIDDFVWLLQISGAAPANHFAGGYAGAISERQPAMYFPLGGGSLKGVGKARRNCLEPRLCRGRRAALRSGPGTVVSLPAAETERRWRETTMQWPIVHTILHGVSQNQMMARHRANHVNVAYAPSAEVADKALGNQGRDARGTWRAGPSLRGDAIKPSAVSSSLQRVHIAEGQTDS